MAQRTQEFRVSLNLNEFTSFFNVYDVSDSITFEETLVTHVVAVLNDSVTISDAPTGRETLIDYLVIKDVAIIYVKGGDILGYGFR